MPRRVSHREHRFFLTVVALGDLVAVAIGYLVPALLRYPSSAILGVLPNPAGAAMAVGTAIIWFAALSGTEAYSPRILLSASDQLVRVLGAAVPAWILTQLLAFALKVTIPFDSRLVSLVVLPSVILILWAWRLMLLRPFAPRVYGRLAGGPVLILGNTERAEQLEVRRRNNDPRRRLVLRQALGAMSPIQLERMIREEGVAEVVIVPSGISSEEVFDLAFACLDAGAEVQIVSTQLDVLSGRSAFGDLDGIPVMRLRRPDLAGPESLFKRVTDFGGALVGIILLAPVFAVIAVAVRFSSPGPVLFRQERVGHKGRLFIMYKFRTMVRNNDPRAHHDYVKAFIQDSAAAQVDASGVKIYKLTADSRVTRVGAVLRALSLDELPQLWNVLKGDMSLVGPRPCLPLEWDLYRPWQRRRLDVAPGCTGLWQVTARSLVGFEEMVILDLYYAHNGSPGRDLLLIAKTVPAMVRGRGGY